MTERRGVEGSDAHFFVRGHGSGATSSCTKAHRLPDEPSHPSQWRARERQQAPADPPRLREPLTRLTRQRATDSGPGRLIHTMAWFSSALTARGIQRPRVRCRGFTRRRNQRQGMAPLVPSRAQLHIHREHHGSLVRRRKNAWRTKSSSPSQRGTSPKG